MIPYIYFDKPCITYPIGQPCVINGRGQPCVINGRGQPCVINGRGHKNAGLDKHLIMTFPNSDSRACLEAASRLKRWFDVS